MARGDYIFGFMLSSLPKSITTYLVIHHTLTSSENSLKDALLGSPVEKDRAKLIVAAIDFGTTYSGCAFQFLHEYEKNLTQINAKNWNNGTNVSTKAPTTVLIRPDGITLEAFGYDAEDKYVELVREEEQHKDWYYFSQFKMMLYDNLKLKREMLLEASNGKKLPAIDIYASAIRYLKETVMAECRQQTTGTILDEEVLWVLTVPAIWTDSAKRFMREAGQKAGIQDDNLVLALEPEVASIFCKSDSLQLQKTKEITPFTPGSKYIVLDAGGGTVDITAHEILEDGSIKELHRPVGGNWGGTTVNKSFQQLLSDVFGPAVLDTFREESPDDFIDLFRVFEVRKRDVSFENNKAMVINIPYALAKIYETQTGGIVLEALKQGKYAQCEFVAISKGNKLRVGADIMRGFFEDASSNIVAQIGEILDDEYVKPCTTILLVGGFSESPIIKETLTRKIKDIRIINPDNSSLIVLKGAVLFGRKQSIISHRICRYTYGHELLMKFEECDPEEYMVIRDGVKFCEHRFDVIVSAGTVLKTTEITYAKKTFKPYESDTGLVINLYKTSKSNPRYVTEPDCANIGTLEIDFDGKKNGKCVVRGQFGGTEIKLEIIHKATGKAVSATFD